MKQIRKEKEKTYKRRIEPWREKLPPALIEPEIEPEGKTYTPKKPARVLLQSEIDAAVERAIARSASKAR